MADVVTDEALVRCEAYDTCRRAFARGGHGALQELVADAWVDRARLQARIDALERDTIPCGAPEEGEP